MFLSIANAIHIFPQTNETCYMKKSQKTINKNSDMVENFNYLFLIPHQDLIKIPLKHYSVCLKEKMEMRKQCYLFHFFLSSE